MGFFGHRKRPLVVQRHDDETATGKNPFDAFLSAAISAILAIFFAWRIFFFSEKRTPSIEAASSSESDIEDDEKTLNFIDDMSDFEENKKDDAKSPLKSVSTLLETDSLPSSSRPIQAPPPIPAFDPDELSAAIEKIRTPPEQSPEYKINTFGVLKDLEDDERKKALESFFESGTPPEDWIGEQADFMVFTDPGLVQFMSSGSMDPSNFGYLDAITEEDSDDLRSHSSASSHKFGSAQSSIRAPSADVVEQVDNRISQILENLDEEKTPTNSRRESGPEILSEASESLTESETTMHPRISQVKIEQEKQMADLDRDQAEIIIQNPSVSQSRHFQPEVSSPSVSIDFDNSRDSLLDQSVCSNPQDETLILEKFVMDSNEENQQFLTPKIPSDTLEEKHDESFDSEGYPPPPLPQIPPPEDDTVEEIHILEKIKEVEPIELLTKPTIPKNSEEFMIDATDEEIRPKDPTTTEFEIPDLPKPTTEGPSLESQLPRKPPADLSSPERLSSLLYGYNSGLSPLYWQTRKLSPDENKENTKLNNYQFDDPIQTTLIQPLINESSYNSIVGPNYRREERTTFQKETVTKPSLNVEFDRSSKRLARYGPIYADAPLSYSTAFDTKDSQMDYSTSEIPSHLPPNQPTTQRTYAESTGYRTDADTSRDDLISDGGRRSRTTIREIPVQRSQSAFSYSRAPTTNGGSIMDIKTIGAGGSGWTTVRHDTNLPGEEYYRREVMTRTLVTRSTEALSQQPQLPPPLSRSPIDAYRYLPEPRDEITEEYITKYSRSVEEEERRIRDNQEKRRQEEEERRRREEEIRRRFEQEENIRLEKIRRDKMRIEKDLEEKIIARERIERDRVERERREREEIERKRRQEWERLENERRALEEQELARRRELERLEKERLERERLEAERLEKERLARERAEIERLEMERLERERIERERIEIERLEIERIERIKREQIERERRDREREQRERERLEQERLEAERLERERIERERLEREMIEQQRREAEQRERERLEDEMKEMMRREQEAREHELILQAEREAQERERQRRIQEQREKDRLEAIRREQERLERERQEAERRERERGEAERRERELLAAKEAARLRREKERIEEEQRERERLEQERLERERRERERREAIERERLRQLEEQKERDALLELERIAAERRAQRELEERRGREREALERETEMLREQERLEAEKRERERIDEERRLGELKELERRNAAQRDAERREAAEREAARRRDDRRSRERLDLIVKEREDREKWELEKKRLLAEREAAERKRKDLTSRETLERLTRKPYYSRENLSAPEITTKVERQVIERVDRTLYTSDGQPITTTSYFTGGGSSTNPPLEHYPGDDLIERDRLFQQRNDDLRDSKRAGRYRSRVEKDRARRDFFSADSSQNDAFERMKKSTEDLSRKMEYRGPLLSKFNSGEFSTPNRLIGSIDVDSGYPRVGPGQYDKEYRRLYEKAERQLAHYRNRTHSVPRNYARYLDASQQSHHSSQPRETDDINRSRSVLDYNSTVQQETTTRRGWYSPKADGNHTRSKSVDLLMDQRAREDSLVPENELQKQRTDQISEHEMRFRKSVEKLSTPDWYKDYSTKQQTYSSSQQRYDIPSSNQPWSYTNPPLVKQSTSTSPPVGGINFPSGMFDKYKDEIEDMRRSRTSLHQIGQSTTPQEHTKDYHHIRGSTELLNNMPPETAAITREYSQETMLRKLEKTTIDKRLPGYTVSTVPSEWDLGKDMKVVEVADTFIGKQQESANKNIRYGGRVTIEEALDTIFQQTKLTNNSYDTSLPQSERPIGQNIEGPGIYTSNYMLMDKVIEQPHLAEDLLSKEHLFVRCGRCHKTKSIKEGRGYYVSCKHCYTYYCSRHCRQLDWERHRDRCSFARINTLCKDVIMKVRQDAETQYHMSRVARDGYKNFGRGSVNIRLMSAYAAQQYLIKGWKAFENLDHTKLLFYYPVDALIDQGKEQSLITLCRKYNPNDKFILSVSIVADIEFCPETPPLEDQNQRQRYDFPPIRRSQPDMYSALVPTDV